MTHDTTAFLNHLFIRAGGFFELVAIHPTRERGAIRPFAYDLARDRVDWDQIATFNADGYGIYYGTTTARSRPPAGRRRREADVLTLPCVWVEIDCKDGVFVDVDAILAHLYAFDYPPSFLISSGGGVHVLWMVEPVEVTQSNRAAIKEILRGLAIHLHADTSATDLARVLRLPGTVNTKPERNGARCEILDALPGQFTLDDFAPYRQYAAPIKRPIERDLPRYQPDNLPRVVQAYIDSATAPGQRNNALNTAAFIMHTEGYPQSEAERVLLAKALSDGLSEREALRTILSAYTAPPGTPGYLSGRGGLRMRAGDAVRRLRGK